MQESSTILGIVIRMYYRDHPPPHFHARSMGSTKSAIEINSGIRPGRYPRRALGGRARNGTVSIQDDGANWEQARCAEALNPIDPLE